MITSPVTAPMDLERYFHYEIGVRGRVHQVIASPALQCAGHLLIESRSAATETIGLIVVLADVAQKDCLCRSDSGWNQSRGLQMFDVSCFLRLAECRLEIVDQRGDGPIEDAFGTRKQRAMQVFHKPPAGLHLRVHHDELNPIVIYHGGASRGSRPWMIVLDCYLFAVGAVADV